MQGPSDVTGVHQAAVLPGPSGRWASVSSSARHKACVRPFCGSEDNLLYMQGSIKLYGKVLTNLEGELSEFEKTTLRACLRAPPRVVPPQVGIHCSSQLH